MLQKNEDIKTKWENFYTLVDPYGQDKWFSDIMRRKSTLELITSRGLKFDHCLELGCGEGRITKEILKFSNKVTAVEISSNAIKTAKLINKDNLQRIEFIEGDMYEVSFEPESFDLINGIEALDYTKNKVEEINKWIVWLKSEGYIIFSGPNLPKYFTYYELKNLFLKDELEICELKIVTTKFPLQWFINRFRFLQNNFFWSLNMLPTKLFPNLLSQHIAVLAKK